MGRNGQENGNASKKHHKCVLQPTGDIETAGHVMYKVHTVIDYYDEMSLKSYTYIIIFVFFGDG